MKRNMLAIVILAATLVNVTLSAVLLFTVIPKAKRTDALIEKIVAAVELETESGIGKGYGQVAPADQEEFVFQKEYVNIKATNGEASVALANITVTLNMKHEDYSTIQPLIEGKKSKIVYEVNNVISDYTMAELRTYADDIEKNALKKIQEIFQSDCVIEVTLQVYGGN